MTHEYRSSEHGAKPILKLMTAALALVSVLGTAAAHQWDVSVRGIYRPSSAMDSGTAVVPQGIVKNFGDSTASFPLLFTIDTVYADTQYVNELGPGVQDTIAFDTWLAIERGRHTARCSTALAEDESTANDRVARNITVVVRDISFDSIIAPRGVVHLKIPLTPQTRFTNRGTNTVGFRASMRVGPSYDESLWIPDLPAESSRTVSFPSWTPWSLGTFADVCTLNYDFGDMVPGNDWTLDSCTVVAISKDAGTMRVVAPTGTVDTGTAVAPQVMVRNCGFSTISFPVILRIGTDYVDTAQVLELARYDSTLVTFDDWTASPAGTTTIRCSTALAGDSNATNDARTDSVSVLVRRADVGAVRVVGLPDTVNWITVLSPQVVVYNYGLDTQSFAVAASVTKGMAAIYRDTQQVTSLAPHESLVVSFKEDSVMNIGLYVATCSTRLAGDQVMANDKVSQDIFLSWRDVGAVWIFAPAGTVPVDSVVTPTACVHRFGTSTDSFSAVFTIGTFYAETIRTRDTIVRFPPCTLKLAGTWMTRCSTALSDDIDSTNDFVSDSVKVVAAGINGGSAPEVPRDVILSAAGSSVLADRATIRYGLPKYMDARLVVYDACGRPVQVLATGAAKPGYYTVTWQGTDERGRAAPDGAYFVRLTAGDKSLTTKIVKLE